MLPWVMLRHCESCEIGVPGTDGPDLCQFGFRKTEHCAVFVAVVRSTIEKASASAKHLDLGQLDFVRGYVAMKPTAIEPAMRARRVAAPVVAALLKDRCNTELTVRYST